jgi:hypothetical protein
MTGLNRVLPVRTGERVTSFFDLLLPMASPLGTQCVVEPFVSGTDGALPQKGRRTYED